jgi:hypothetical protein
MYWWCIAMLVILQCSSFASVLADLCVASILAALVVASALAALGILRFIVKLNLVHSGICAYVQSNPLGFFEYQKSKGEPRLLIID